MCDRTLVGLEFTLVWNVPVNRMVLGGCTSQARNVGIGSEHGPECDVALVMGHENHPKGLADKDFPARQVNSASAGEHPVNINLEELCYHTGMCYPVGLNLA